MSDCDFRERVTVMATNTIIDFMQDNLSQLAREHEKTGDRHSFSKAVHQAIRYDLVDEPAEAARNGRISHMVAAVGEKFMNLADISQIIDTFWEEDEKLRMYDMQYELVTSLHAQAAHEKEREAIWALQQSIECDRRRRKSQLIDRNRDTEKP